MMFIYLPNERTGRVNSGSCTPQAFIFDCDGTILDSMDMWLDLGPEFLRRYGIQVTAKDLAQFEHLALEEECEAYHRKWGIGRSGKALFEEMSLMLQERYQKMIAPRKNVRAFLDAAKAADIPMSIATSTPSDLVRLGLEANGLERYFSNITTTGEAGSSKKHADVYDLSLKTLMEHLGEAVPPRSSVWVFEDAVFGLMSSGAAGYKRVGIHDPAGRCDRNDVIENSEIFIDDFSDELLDRIISFGM